MKSLSLSRSILGVALLILLGQALLLTTQVADQAMWSDEMYTARIVNMPTVDTALAQVRLTETRPPLHYLVLWTWARIAGLSEWSMRFISVAATLLATALAFRLAADLTSPRAAVWAMLFTATAPSLLLHGTIIRGYAFAMPLVLLSVLAFWRACQSPARRYKLIYLISTVALLFTDYMAAPIVGAQLVVLIGAAWQSHGANQQSLATALRRQRGWLIMLAGLILTVAALVIFMRSQVGSSTAQGNFAGLNLTSAITRIPRNLPNSVAGTAMLLYLFSVGEALLPWFPLAIPAALMTLILGGVGWRIMWRTRRSAAIFIGVMIAVPLLFNAAVVFTLLLPTSMLVISAARSLYLVGLLFIPIGAVFAAPVVRRWAWVALSIWLAARGVSALNQWQGHSYLNPVHEVNTRLLAQQVERNIQPGDQIVFEEPLAFDYYFRALDETTPLYTTGGNHIGYTVPENLAPDDPVFSGQNQRFIAAISPERLLAALQVAPPRRLWLITFQHESDEKTVEQEIAAPLAQAGQYRLVSHIGYAPQDPLYARLRTLLRPRTPITYKAEIVLYERNSP